jgi:hypothetical protein
MRELLKAATHDVHERLHVHEGFAATAAVFAAFETWVNGRRGALARIAEEAA